MVGLVLKKDQAENEEDCAPYVQVNRCEHVYVHLAAIEENKIRIMACFDVILCVDNLLCN